jgi:CheY-like chemotaxis protein
MKARVLLVEDSPLNRRLVHDILEARGHEVIEAASVEETRARLDDFVPNVVLLDVMIPGGGGEAVVRMLRSSEAHRNVPVVAVTGLVMPGDEQRLLANGFDGYIPKPIDTKKFGATVEAWCAGSGSYDQ